MYRPNDIEILDAYEDYVQELSGNDEVIDRCNIWLEAFKRGMRFNPIASQSGVEADACCNAPDLSFGLTNAQWICKNCGKTNRTA